MKHVDRDLQHAAIGWIDHARDEIAYLAGLELRKAVVGATGQREFTWWVNPWRWFEHKDAD